MKLLPNQSYLLLLSNHLLLISLPQVIFLSNLFSPTYSLPNPHMHESSSNDNNSGMHNMADMELPQEHVSFGNCNIRPGKNPSYKPPTEGFTMDITNDYPNQDINYYPRCDNFTYPEAFSETEDRIAQFPLFPSASELAKGQDLGNFYMEKISMETTKSMGVSSFHVPDNEPTGCGWGFSTRILQVSEGPRNIEFCPNKIIMSLTGSNLSFS